MHVPMNTAYLPSTRLVSAVPNLNNAKDKNALRSLLLASCDETGIAFILLIQVWPNGETVFPDFFNPRTQTWWEQCIVKHHDVVPFDGLWIVS